MDIMCVEAGDKSGKQEISQTKNTTGWKQVTTMVWPETVIRFKYHSAGEYI